MTYLDYVFQTYNHLLVYLVANNYETFGVEDMYAWLASSRRMTFFETAHIIKDLKDCRLLDESILIEVTQKPKDSKELEKLIAKHKYNVKKNEINGLLKSVPFEDFCSNDNEFRMMKDLAAEFDCYIRSDFNGRSTQAWFNRGISMNEINSYIKKMEELGVIKQYEVDSRFPEFNFENKITNRHYKGLRNLANALDYLMTEHFNDDNY